MSSIPLTIDEIFEMPSDEEVLSKSLDQGRQKELKAALKGIPEFSVDMVREEVGVAYRKLLDIDIFDIFSGAWLKLKELQTYLDKTKHPPEEVSLVPLAEHTIRSEHHPQIEILIGEKQLFNITFDVLLEFKLTSFVLKIKDGCIHEIKTGSFKCAGIIKCGGEKLVEKKSSKYKLPASIAFNECFKIPCLNPSLD